MVLCNQVLILGRTLNLLFRTHSTDCRHNKNQFGYLDNFRVVFKPSPSLLQSCLCPCKLQCFCHAPTVVWSSWPSCTLSCRSGLIISRIGGSFLPRVNDQWCQLPVIYRLPSDLSLLPGWLLRGLWGSHHLYSPCHFEWKLISLLLTSKGFHAGNS